MNRDGTHQEVIEIDRNVDANPQGRGLGGKLREPMLPGWVWSAGRGAVILAGVIAAWYLAIALWDLHALTLPPPHEVWVAGAADWPILAAAGWITLKATLIAFALSAVFGVAIAGLVAWSQLARQFILPLVVGLQAAPKIAIAPLLLIWVGFGLRIPIIIGTLIAVFPVIINTVVGLHASNPDVILLTRTMRASGWATFRHVKLPYAMSAIVGGLKTALVLAIVGVVVGEFMGGNAGLGYVLSSATAQFRVPFAYSALAVLVAGSLVLFGVLESLERRLAWYAGTG